jgi:hypothetical protein
MTPIIQPGLSKSSKLGSILTAAAAREAMMPWPPTPAAANCMLLHQSHQPHKLTATNSLSPSLPRNELSTQQKRTWHSPHQTTCIGNGSCSGHPAGALLVE